MPAWQYDEPSRRYRNAETGRYVSAASERAIRDDYIGRRQADIKAAAGKVASGELAVAQWERQMQRTLREMHGVQASFGAGGRKQVPEALWQRMAGVVTAQEQYLADFAAAIARGELSQAQIAARAAMYGDAARSSYHQGKAAAFDGLTLPAMPGQGTPCMVNCACEWEIVETDGEWRATWTLGATEHCQGCIDRAATWNPYTQPRAVGVAA